MTEVLFYHLEQARLEDILPGLLEKTLGRGWRAQVRVGSEAYAQTLDTLLWTYRDDAFLPHDIYTPEREGEGSPVELTHLETAPLTGRDILFLTDGARAAHNDLGALKRCVVIFNGHDEGAVQDARGFWKIVVSEDHDATYWRQNFAGRWEKQN